VIDPHPLVRLGVREALAADFEIQESASRLDAIELVRDVGSVDVAVVDLRCEPKDGAPSGNEAIRALRDCAPTLGIVAHGERAERHIATAALQAGASSTPPCRRREAAAS